MISHIQRHPRTFFPLQQRVRAMVVASCERCYRPLTGCITKLCKVPTCAINIFKNLPARVLSWHVRIYTKVRYAGIYSGSARAYEISVSRDAHERLAFILYFCRRICGRESLENVPRSCPMVARPSALSDS